MGYLAPGLYSVIPQLDSFHKTEGEEAPEPLTKAGQLGYHRRSKPQLVEGDNVQTSTSAVDSTGWRNYISNT